VVSPRCKREAVGILTAERGLGVTRACGLVGISRSLYRYQSRVPPALELRQRIAEIAVLKRRYGYRKIHVRLRREGWPVNHKKVYRLYREQGLAVRRRKRKRIGLAQRLVRPAPQAPNQSWSMDYLADGLIDGRKLRVLAIIDDYTRECLALEVDTSLPSARVVAVLERLADLRGLPSSIRVDHGPEFESEALDAWAYKRAVQLAFIRPGKPVDNCHIESFNGRLRDECLNEHWFLSMQHARTTIEAWRIEYNTERTHSSLGDLTPEEFRAAHASRRSADRVRENLENVVSLTPDSTSIPY
jgi:putative transposase